MSTGASEKVRVARMLSLAVMLGLGLGVVPSAFADGHGRPSGTGAPPTRGAPPPGTAAPPPAPPPPPPPQASAGAPVPRPATVDASRLTPIIDSLARDRAQATGAGYELS